jgi:hypothetical protein
MEKALAMQMVFSWDSRSSEMLQALDLFGAGDGDRTRNQRLGKPLLYH